MSACESSPLRMKTSSPSLETSSSTNLLLQLAQPPGRAQRTAFVGENNRSVAFGALAGHHAGHVVGNQRCIHEVHDAESNEVVAFGAVVLLHVGGERLVLLVTVGVHVEYHEVLLAPVRQFRGFAIEVNQSYIFHFAGQLLSLDNRKGQGTCRESHQCFQLHCHTN